MSRKQHVFHHEHKQSLGLAIQWGKDFEPAPTERPRWPFPGATCPACNVYATQLTNATTGDLVCSRCGHSWPPPPPAPPAPPPKPVIVWESKGKAVPLIKPLPKEPPEPPKPLSPWSWYNDDYP